MSWLTATQHRRSALRHGSTSVGLGMGRHLAPRCFAVLCVALIPAATSAAERRQAKIIAVDAVGLPHPASQIDVQVVTLAADSKDAAAKPLSVLKVTADMAGVISFPGPESGQIQRLRFIERGVPVNAPIEATGQIVGRYQQPLTSADVTLRVRANVEVRDGGLRAWLLYTFRTTRPGSVRWQGDTAIALPLLAPIVGDVVLDRGSVPAAARHIETTVEGDATLERRDGALMLSGVIAPGRPISVRVRYPIGIQTSTVALGLRGVVGKTHLAVAAIGVRPSRPRLLSDKPARGGRTDEGEDRMAGLTLAQPINAGEVARVWVTDLPVNAAWPKRVLASLALLFALFALAAMLRRRSWHHAGST